MVLSFDANDRELIAYQSWRYEATLTEVWRLRLGKVFDLFLIGLLPDLARSAFGEAPCNHNVAHGARLTDFHLEPSDMRWF